SPAPSVELGSSFAGGQGEELSSAGPALPPSSPAPSAGSSSSSDVFYDASEAAETKKKTVPVAGARRADGSLPGVCRDNAAGRGAQCFRCSFGHKCVPCPAGVAPFANRLIEAIEADEPQNFMDQYRAALRTALELEEDGRL
ncbi:hypothetical protein IFR05_015939, partial [Cadophora sp. M221]